MKRVWRKNGRTCIRICGDECLRKGWLARFWHRCFEAQSNRFFPDARWQAADQPRLAHGDDCSPYCPNLHIRTTLPKCLAETICLETRPRCALAHATAIPHPGIEHPRHIKLPSTPHRNWNTSKMPRRLSTPQNEQPSPAATIRNQRYTAAFPPDQSHAATGTIFITTITRHPAHAAGANARVHPHTATLLESSRIAWQDLICLDGVAAGTHRCQCGKVYAAVRPSQARVNWSLVYE